MQTLKTLQKTLLIATLSILSLAVFTTSASAQSVGDVDTANSSCLNLQNNLRYRMRDSQVNGEVSDLQDFLADNNYLTDTNRGYFGLKTVAAVKAFQRSNSLLASGYVGPLTRAKIGVVSCGGTSVSVPPISITPTNSVMQIVSVPSVNTSPIISSVSFTKGSADNTIQNNQQFYIKGSGFMGVSKIEIQGRFQSDNYVYNISPNQSDTEIVGTFNVSNVSSGISPRGYTLSVTKNVSSSGGQKGDFSLKSNLLDVTLNMNQSNKVAIYNVSKGVYNPAITTEKLFEVTGIGFAGWIGFEVLISSEHGDGSVTKSTLPFVLLTGDGINDTRVQGFVFSDGCIYGTSFKLRAYNRNSLEVISNEYPISSGESINNIKYNCKG